MKIWSKFSASCATLVAYGFLAMTAVRGGSAAPSGSEPVPSSSEGAPPSEMSRGSERASGRSTGMFPGYGRVLRDEHGPLGETTGMGKESPASSGELSPSHGTSSRGRTQTTSAAGSETPAGAPAGTSGEKA